MAYNDLTFEQKENINLPRYCRNIANDNRQKCIDNLGVDPVLLLPDNWKGLDYQQRLDLRQTLWDLANDAERVRVETFRANNPNLKPTPTTIEMVYHIAGTAE
jgi:hypothetical protein